MSRFEVRRTVSRVGVSAGLIVGLVLAGGIAPAQADSLTYVYVPNDPGVVEVTASLDGIDFTARFSEVLVAGDVYFATEGVVDYDTSTIGDVSDYVYRFGDAGAEFFSGTVQLCFSYDPGAGVPTLYANVDDEWVSITESIPEPGVVCGVENGSEYSSAYVIGFTFVAGPLPVATVGYEISLDPRIGTTDFTGGVEGPVLDLRIYNPTDTDLRIGFGVDLAVQGVMDRLWLPDTWGGGLTGEDIGSFFRTTVASGEVFEWTIPDWPGKTYGFYLLPDIVGPADLGQLVGYSTTSGGFVPFRFDWNLDNAFELGREASVAGTGANPELFPGVSATVTASGLTPGETHQLWLAPQLDYFYFMLLGALLPADAIYVGTGTVGPAGDLSATFQIPANAPLDRYQLVVGNPANRYWPAGSYGDFIVGLPSASNSAATSTGAGVSSISLGSTLVDLLFSNVLTSGTTTVASSQTGPVASSYFYLASNPAVFYHIDTTATFDGSVEVCITYDPATLTGGIPWLYHYKQLGPNSYQWQSITTSRIEGKVCGETNSFSPFALGYTLTPEVILTNKDQCKNGGWATSTLPMYRNQGECVSYFASQGKSKGK